MSTKRPIPPEIRDGLSPCSIAEMMILPVNRY